MLIIENFSHLIGQKSLINFKKGRIMHKFKLLCVFFYSNYHNDFSVYQ